MISTSNSRERDYIDNIFTKEESNYYSIIFNKLDNPPQGKISSTSVYKFIQSLGFDENVINKKFSHIKRKDVSYFQKEELFHLLKLFGLKQNNKPFNNQCLNKNSPNPKYNNPQKGNNNQEIYELKEEEKTCYSNIFYLNKDTFFDFMTIGKVREFFNGINLLNKLDDVLILINPKITGFLSIYEFIVAYHLLVKSQHNKLPKILPEKLKNLLDETINLSFTPYNNHSNINNINPSFNNNICAPSINPSNMTDPFFGIPSNNTINLSLDKIPKGIKDLNSKILIEKKFLLF